MKMEVTQSIIIVKYMLCFYKKSLERFFSSDIVETGHATRNILE